MIFVFGSNKAGIHGAGAALHARLTRNAEPGIGEGPTGSCYALPTKGFQIEYLSLSEVKPHIDKFIEYAESEPNQDFKVTRVGCGLGGFTDNEIAPLFKDAPDNCYFDLAWKDILGSDRNYWGSF